MATADVSVNDDSCNGQLGLNYSKEGEFLRNISIFRDLVTGRHLCYTLCLSFNAFLSQFNLVTRRRR